MLVRLQRSEPPGGPWLMWSETGRFLDFVSGGVTLDIEGNEAWFDAVVACNGWNLQRTNAPDPSPSSGNGATE